MSIDKVRNYLKQFQLNKKILEFETSSATVELAAETLNCVPGRIAKTMSFLVNDKPILIVLAGDIKIDNSKYKTEFHTKAKMVPVNDVENLIGHAAGGVCPFGINEGIKVYLDESLKKYETVFPACGSSNSAIELTIKDLEKTSKYSKWVDIGKLNI